MAANDTKKITLPSSVVSTIIGKVKDTSTIATLSPSTPQKFADTTYLVFNPTAEAEVVAEGGHVTPWSQSAPRSSRPRASPTS